MAAHSIDINVASNGRMVLPASVRKAMGLHGDAKIILTVEDDQVRLSPIGHGVSRAQALYRAHAKRARTTDDFLEERKVEAAAELGGARPTPWIERHHDIRRSRRIRAAGSGPR